jgi:Protein of unknown function (DUF3617)
VRNVFNMRNSLIACGVVLITLRVVAAGFGLKPGLWETQVTKQVVDGKDTTAQINGATAQMQKMMANLSPEQRAKMEAMFKSNGASLEPGGGLRLCISPEMANRDTPWVDPKGRCQPAKVSRSGNQASFEVNCASDGTTTTGKGVSTISGDSVTSVMDMTTTKPGGETRVIHMETAMKFLSADCGDVKPLGAPSGPAAPK